MSENGSQIKAGDGCLVHAGILESHGGNKENAELTRGYSNSAVTKFIDEVINELVNPNTDPLPCGKPIPPLDPKFAEAFKDLHDEKKFKDFHKNIIGLPGEEGGLYRSYARTLEAASNFQLMNPVGPCDPIALGKVLFPQLKIEIKSLTDFVKFAIPNPAALAQEFAKAGATDPIVKQNLNKDVPLTPAGLLVELANKATVIKPPPKPLTLPALPSNDWAIAGGSIVRKPFSQGGGVPAQSVGPDLAYQVGQFNANIVTFIPELVLNMPAFVLQLLTQGPAQALNAICGLVADDSGLLGEGKIDDNGKPQDIAMRAARKVLARKITEMSVFHAMAVTIGSDKNGIVGIAAGNDSTKSSPPSPPEIGKETDVEKASSQTKNQMVPEYEQQGSAAPVPANAVEVVPKPDDPDKKPQASTEAPDGSIVGGRPYGADQYNPSVDIPKSISDQFNFENFEKSAVDKDVSELSDEELAKMLEENIPPPRPVPPPSTQKDKKLDDPFALRGYDLPLDEEPQVEILPAGAGGGGGGSAVVAKAQSALSMGVDGSSLKWSKNPKEYSEFIFYTEYAQNEATAIDMAKVASSCGLFARACLRAAGASYVYNPKKGGWKNPFIGEFAEVDGVKRPYVTQKFAPRVGETAQPDENTAVGKRLDTTSVLLDYFNDNYPVGSAVAAIMVYAKTRDAIRGGENPKSMPAIREGDIIVIGYPEHVIVVETPFDPNNFSGQQPAFTTIEGGQQDESNIGTAAYKPKRGALASAFKRLPYFWNAPDNVIKQYVDSEILSKNNLTAETDTSGRRFDVRSISSTGGQLKIGQKKVLMIVNSYKLLGVEEPPVQSA